MRIYLAGSVPKGDQATKEYQDWRHHYTEVLAKYFDAEYITPKAGEVDERDALLVVGKDSRSIKISDLVVVFAEEKIGAGTAMELVIAKHFKKPVVTVLPKDTHHRRSNVVFNGEVIEDWIHPFIVTFSDYVLDSIEDIASIKDQIFNKPIKDISIIDQAVAHREESLK
jgi:hypothetical protein